MAQRPVIDISNARVQAYPIAVAPPQGDGAGQEILAVLQADFDRSGLFKVLDLGQWWREQTGLPLPLGGNAIRRSLGEETRNAVGFVASNELLPSNCSGGYLLHCPTATM